MKLRALFEPGYYTPIPLSIGMMLIGMLLCILQVSKLLEYTELRLDTVAATGFVENIVNSIKTGNRSYLQSRVVYVFYTPDGVRHTGSITYPAVRMEHLKWQSKVQVYYNPRDPSRNTIVDDFFMRLWWGIIPLSSFAIFWFASGVIFLRQTLRHRISSSR